MGIDGSMPKGIRIKSLIQNTAQEIETDPGVATINNEPITSELGGRLIRAINIDELGDYLNHRSNDTGHIIFTKRPDRIQYHVLIIQGKPMAAFSESSPKCGSALIEALFGVPGVVEYYFIEEPTIRSILNKYPQIVIRADGKSGQPIPIEKIGERLADGEKVPAGPETAGPADDKLSGKPVAIQAKPPAGRKSDDAIAETGDKQGYGIENDQTARAIKPDISDLLRPEPAIPPRAKSGLLPPERSKPERVSTFAGKGNDKNGAEGEEKTAEGESLSRLDALLKRLKLRASK